MNKIFKVIWNPATGSYTVASETAKSRGKKSGRSKLLISALVVGGLLSSGVQASTALDGGGASESTPLTDTWIAIGQGAKASSVDTSPSGGPGTSSIAIGQEAQSGIGSTSLGFKSQATGERSVALGQTADATGNRAIAIGSGAKSTADYSLTLGNGSKAFAENATAIGKDARAEGKGSQAFGKVALATGENAIALGSNSNASGDNAVALGSTSQAYGDSSLAIGELSETNAENAIALGKLSNASKINSIALGSNSTASGVGSVALGENSFAGGINSLALGSQSNANGDNAVALGVGSVAEQDNTVSVGNSTTQRKITNMAAGLILPGSTEAINGSQLHALSASVAARLGAGAGVNGDGSINAPSYKLKSGTYNNVGEALLGIDNDTLHWDKTEGAFSASYIVKNADGSPKSSIAQNKIINVAKGTISATSTDVVNGSQLYDLQQDALLWNGTAFSAAHGTEATSKITNVEDGTISDTSKDAVNGSQLKETKDDVATNTANIATNTTDIATNTANIADNTANIATNTTDIATNTADIATNASSITTLNADVDTLEKDALLWNGTAFSAKHGTEATSKITNLLAGKVSSDSTDAINGSQLYGVADSFTSYLGGGADISDAGVLTGPTYTIGGTDYTNVGDALAAINTSFSSSLGDALLWDATAGKFSAKHGINNDPSVITDVANGAVSSTSSDAINGSQLYGVSDYIADALGGNAVVNADGSITTPTYAIAGGSYDNVGDALEAIDTTLDDALLWDETANGGNGAFSAAHGKDKTASVITNVANGAVSATSSDAINGSQLYSTNKYIADALGGDAEVNADGTITAPTYTIANTDYNNVGEALDALDNNALLWDATANNGAGAYSASHDGKASIITNVADGNIGEDSTDAINGSQLNATNMMIQQNSEIINQLAGDTSKNYIGDNGAGINYVRTNDSGLAFNDASAAGIGSTAVGYNTVAKGDSSVAIGHGSNSIVETSIALGSESVSSRLIVKGSRNTRVTENGVEIGYDTTDGELLGALSIGDDGKYRQIINVADGSEAHDAVTVRQLQNAIGAVATTPTKYYHANSTAEDSLAVGEDSLAMGAKTIVNGNAGIGIGLNTLVLADAINGIAIGSNARANHADSIAMGNGSQTTRGAQTNYTAYNMDAPQNSVGEFSVGSEDGQRQITNVAAGSADTDAVNVGQLKVTDAQVSQNTQSITNLNTQVTNLDTRVTNIENGIGDIVTTGSTKYFKTNTDGADANAQGKDSVAIGSGSIAAADNSVALGTGSVADEENTISVGSSTNQRRITNVAAGVNATDAVNVSQLKSSEAGGVRYDTKADGSIDYSNITLGGGNGGTTRISNVSAGVNNNDAVNYAQLKQSVQETKQYTDQRMVEMDNKLSKTESKLSGGIASAMAMTGLPQAYTPGASMASIGGGTYNGESAVALGVSMVSANGRWVYKLQGSTNSQGEYSAALGAGIQW
ncbi:YadA-like family protein [Escherichia coli]|uniref:YadA-like family protein n=1 Tax=Escherichia coli TaxID=562 RepID=UPI000E20DBA6|nr:YadA-like family protein [Escherichia coli]MCI4482285.1 YadA-like family protein [Escherichia coli]MCI4511539.1 YadA-like family protein [Escherichia coli]MCI4576267.1 YadA-like family protein [Escherichia coli]HAL0988638.1 adhesin [Escherichia coli]HAL6385614.1 adhesin [Escherichia coli]